MRFLALVLGVVLTWGGGQSLFTLTTNRHPSQYRLDTYLSQRPKEKWLRLTHCVVDLTLSSYSSFRGRGPLTEVYVPLRPLDPRGDGGAAVLIATRDEHILQLVDRMRRIGDRSKVKAFVTKHRDELMVERDVEGLVRFGIELRDRDKERLRRLYPKLPEDFVIIDEGKRPSWTASLLILPGLLLALWSVAGLWKTRAAPVSRE